MSVNDFELNGNQLDGGQEIISFSGPCVSFEQIVMFRSANSGPTITIEQIVQSIFSGAAVTFQQIVE